MDIDCLDPGLIHPFQICGHGSQITLIGGKVEIGLGRHLGAANSVIIKCLPYGGDRFVHGQKILDLIFPEPEYLHNSTIRIKPAEKK